MLSRGRWYWEREYSPSAEPFIEQKCGKYLYNKILEYSSIIVSNLTHNLTQIMVHFSQHECHHNAVITSGKRRFSLSRVGGGSVGKHGRHNGQQQLY